MSEYLHRFSEMVTGVAKEDRAALKRYSIDIRSNEMLAVRIEGISLILGEMEKTRDTVTRIELLNNLLHICIVPWGAGGDKENSFFAILMMYWEKLLKSWRDIRTLGDVSPRSVTVVLSLIDEILGAAHNGQPLYSYTNLSEIAELLQYFGEREIIPYGFMIYNAGFKMRDISPQYVAILQTQGQGGFGGGGGGIIVPTAAMVQEGKEYKKPDRTTPAPYLMPTGLKKREQAEASPS